MTPIAETRRARGSSACASVVAALILQGWGLCASACSPTLLVFRPESPVPAEVVRGLVTADSRNGQWERTVRIQPKAQLRGSCVGDLQVAASCGSESPRVGETVLVFREKAGEGEWRLVPSWQADEFLQFLGGADGETSAGEDLRDERERKP